MYHLWAKRLVGPALSKVACKVLLCSVTQLCLTLCEPMDYSPPGSLVHGISQARILKQAAISFFVGGGGGGVLICSFGPFLGCKYSHRESHFQATRVRSPRLQLGRDMLSSSSLCSIPYKCIGVNNCKSEDNSKTA